MAQTLVPVDLIKDRQVATAIDAAAQIMSNMGFNAGGTALDGVVIGGATPAAATVTTLNSTGTTALAGASTNASALKALATASSVNQWVATGAVTSSSPTFLAGGTSSDATVGATLGTAGTGTIAFNTSSTEVQLQVTRTASAVNNLTITGSISTNPVVLAPVGTGATLGMHLQAKSTGAIFLGGATTAAASLQVATVASAVNQIVVTPTVTGTAPSLSVGGSGGDANRDLLLQGIGTGGAKLKGATGAVAVAAGYVGETLGDMVFGTGTTATVTLTQANPGVITWTTHGFSTQAPQPVVFTTGGALPTNITSGTVYYTVPSSVTASTFQIATSVTNALAGTSIDTTAGSNTGTQTGTAGCKMANTTAIDVTGLALTAGDWDVWGELVWNANAATTWTTLEGSISQTSATLATTGKIRGTTYASLNQISAAATNGVTSLEISPCIVSVSATTNVFLVVKGAFATNIIGAFGYIMARRRA